MVTTTRSKVLARASTANLTDSSFPSRIPTITPPAAGTNGVIAWANASGDALAGPDASALCPNTLRIIPIGTGADNATFNLRVTGWDVCGDVWIPTPIIEVACTLGTAVGLAAHTILNTERFCDTITSVQTNAGSEIYSLTDDRIGWVDIDGLGHAFLEVTVNLAGSATAANALVRGF